MHVLHFWRSKSECSRNCRMLLQYDISNSQTKLSGCSHLGLLFSIDPLGDGGQIYTQWCGDLGNMKPFVALSHLILKLIYWMTGLLNCSSTIMKMKMYHLLVTLIIVSYIMILHDLWGQNRNCKYRWERGVLPLYWHCKILVENCI